MPVVLHNPILDEHLAEIPSEKVTIEAKTARVDHIKDFVSDVQSYPSPLVVNKKVSRPVPPDELILPGFPSRSQQTEFIRYVRAGPRKKVYFKSDEVKAAIISCGGLCPGINTVVRELVMSLWYLYGVRHITGIKYGLEGLYRENPSLQLEPDLVNEYHTVPGSLLGSSRGGFDLPKLMDGLIYRGINQLYIIGGDGTHRAAAKIAAEVKKRKLKLCVMGIPKTVDNDIPVIDKSFGFDTAVQAAQIALNAAYYEAISVKHGVGLVKLMGRSSGSMALHATLSSRVVNICLVPEVPFELNGPHGLLEYIMHRLETRGHVLIVIAEGCGKYLIEDVKTAPRDKSGNIIYPDAGVHLRNLIVNYARARNIEVNLKYLDPTYAVRSTNAIASDQHYCANLAQQAVHGAMAGHTGCTVGMVGCRLVYIPFWAVEGVAQVDGSGRSWWRMIHGTGQPSFTKIDSKGNVVSPEPPVVPKRMTEMKNGVDVLPPNAAPNSSPAPTSRL